MSAVEKKTFVSYKLNYIPMPVGIKLQPVKGIIHAENGIITIHL